MDSTGFFSVLDRAVSFDTDLYDGLKRGLISMDSTMRSNLGIGLPIGLMVVRRDTCTAELPHRAGRSQFSVVRKLVELRAAHMNIP